MRIDKFLWAVRIYKTRSIASQACKSGKVLIDNGTVKPSREIHIDDVFKVKKSPVVYTYKVKQLLKNRIGAKLVDEYVDNITPDEELNKLEALKTTTFVFRPKGTGRPTKKERRLLDKFDQGEEE